MIVVERPILMSAPMVRSILDDTKTQTRRVVTPQPPPGMGNPRFVNGEWGFSDRPGGRGPYKHVGRCPFGQTGDRLWVREAYTMAQRIMSLAYTPCYRADEGVTENNAMPDGKFPWKWTPAIHMRREHSRINLEVIGIRVEPVQAIEQDDAIAEGVDPDDYPPPPEPEGYIFNYRTGYRQLWDSLNAKRGFGWDKNPWVWVVEFKRI